MGLFLLIFGALFISMGVFLWLVILGAAQHSELDDEEQLRYLEEWKKAHPEKIRSS